jgi:hypothetical protein
LVLDVVHFNLILNRVVVKHVLAHDGCLFVVPV